MRLAQLRPLVMRVHRNSAASTLGCSARHQHAMPLGFELAIRHTRLDATNRRFRHRCLVQDVIGGLQAELCIRRRLLSHSNLREMAHPTQFERVASTFGGQRSSYAANRGIVLSINRKNRVLRARETIPRYSTLPYPCDIVVHCLRSPARSWRTENCGSNPACLLPLR